MQFRRSVGLWVLVGVLVLIGAVLCAVIWRYPEWLGIRGGSDRQTMWLLGTSVTTVVVMVLLGGYSLLSGHLGRAVYRQEDADDVVQAARAAPRRCRERNLRNAPSLSKPTCASITAYCGAARCACCG